MRLILADWPGHLPELTRTIAMMPALIASGSAVLGSACQSLAAGPPNDVVIYSDDHSLTGKSFRIAAILEQIS